MKITNIHQKMTETEFLKNINREDSFVPPKKGDGEIAASLYISDDAQKRFEAEAVRPLERERADVPIYCGIYNTDKAVAAAVEGCTKEERIFVYGIINSNFLMGNTSSLTEEERQANIALGMKKAEYAAWNFIPEASREKFLEAMNTIAKIASAGKADENGNMNYGIKRANYLGHGSNLVELSYNLNADDMKNIDSAAYEEYQRIGEENSGKDRFYNQAEFFSNWYNKQLSSKQGRNMIQEYIEKLDEKSDEYFKKEVRNKKLPTYFDSIDASNKETFLAGIMEFMAKNQNFLSQILSREISDSFWRN